ncbi:hypothetical protein Dda_5018 [Drechslerella dactyloides]|uniref:Uncharacterized protein n=1 Tax=Drechslerella dactyloides TaxID=74499 RepID=A0AAD6IXZ5_DREDA|nr:hypothetical protein Dda_5018 [Drechslerella dactyloides]
MYSMLTTLLRLFAATLRASVNFFLSPLFFVINIVVTFFSRRSKTAASVIVKTQLIRDIILQAPPPSYQSSVKSGHSGNVVRLRILENSLQKRESDLTIRLLALERDRHHLDINRDAFAKRETDFKEKEKTFEEKAGFQNHELSDLAARRRELEQDAAQLVEERNVIERLRSEHASDLQKFQEDATSNQQRLDDRETEITRLHDRFIRSQIETVERYRSEHDALVESLQTRLKDVSDLYQKAEQSKIELEQRLSFLTNELADRTEREFNLGSELGQLRQRLSDERGAFNREFGELSRSLSDLKSRCKQYEQDLAAEERKREDLNNRVKLLDELEDDLKSRQASLDDKENNLQTWQTDLDDRENVMNTRQTNLDDKEGNLSTKEKELDGKADGLRALQITIEERINHIAEAEKDLAARIQQPEELTHEEEGAPSEAPEALLDVPDTATSSPKPPGTPTPSTPIRPNIIERVTRRTSEFVEKVSEAAHRRSNSHHIHHHRYNPDTPHRLTKSRDGIKSEAK